MWIETEGGLFNLDLVERIFVHAHRDEYSVRLGLTDEGYSDICVGTKEECQATLDAITKAVDVVWRPNRMSAKKNAGFDL